MADDVKELFECPPDRMFFLDPSQLRRSDLSALPIEDLLEVQGDVNRMMELMYEHSRVQIPEDVQRTFGVVLVAKEKE